MHNMRYAWKCLSLRSSCWDIIHDSRALKDDSKDRFHANESSYLRVRQLNQKTASLSRRWCVKSVFFYKRKLFCALRRKKIKIHSSRQWLLNPIQLSSTQLREAEWPCRDGLQMCLLPSSDKRLIKTLHTAVQLKMTTSSCAAKSWLKRAASLEKCQRPHPNTSTASLKDELGTSHSKKLHIRWIISQISQHCFLFVAFLKSNKTIQGLCSCLNVKCRPNLITGLAI